MADTLQEELINFMFVRHPISGKLDTLACLRLWFGKSNDTDISIRARFGSHVEAALKGGYSDWKATPRGCLALMILVDQFPRNIYRHTVTSFVGDPLARKIVDLEHDWLSVLTPEECIFIPCLILTHQENLADQQQCLRFYDMLEPILPSELHIFRTIFEEHLKLISLCGTFPHRDHYYGRQTSTVGQSLMENPALRFDLPLVVSNGTVKFGHEPQKLWAATQLAYDVLERIDALANETARRRSSFLPAHLSEKEVAKCQEVFRAFDKDGSGYFDRQELAAVLESTGRRYDSAQLQHAIDRITGIPNSDGITFDQFAAILHVKMTSDWETRVLERFRQFDTDGSGTITLEELETCIHNLDSLVTKAEIEEMFTLCDCDGDGTVSYEEFLAHVPLFMGRKQSVALQTPVLLLQLPAREAENEKSKAMLVFNNGIWDAAKLPNVEVDEIKDVSPCTISF